MNRGWYRDRLGGVTVATARELEDAAQRKQGWALIAGGAGAALAIGGVLRYALAD
jgi:hypothetical protein